MQQPATVASVTTRRPDPAPALVWLVPVVLATAATFATARSVPVDVGLLAVAIVPWLLDALGRTLPAWLFGALGVLPVVAILVVDGLTGSVFLTTTAVCRLASQVDRPWPVAFIAAVGVAVPFASLASDRSFDLGTVYFVIGNLFATAVGVLLGHSRRLGDELREADARLHAHAAQEERARLARDVHDLVAHSLTVVVLQVGGARRVLHVDPAAAELALERAERVCRESLDGVREVVGLLRTGDDAPSTSADLPRLLDTYRTAGVEIDFSADDETVDLPLFVRGTMYRVVRESLANAARYRTPGSPVSVRIDVDVEGVSVLVANAGTAAHRNGPGGYGLRGLTEQVVGIGGTLTSGPVGDRWTVRCRLPRTVSAGRIGSMVQ